MSESLDLGDGHYLRFVEYKDDKKAGADVVHSKPDGTPCEGFITFTGSAWAQSFSHKIPTWDVVNWEPLTLTPSLLCNCGDHGFIRNGRWVKT